MTKNLLQEALATLRSCHKTPNDVHYVVLSSRHRTTFEDFSEIAKNIDYDNGYGSANISPDLCIVGDTWWLSRGEYDGSEWFQYNEKPAMPADVLDTKHLRTALLPRNTVVEE